VNSSSPVIAHVTTVHVRTDTRIRLREATSLAKQFPGNVTLFVQDGLGDDPRPGSGAAIRDTGPRIESRLLRMTLGSWRMYRAVSAVRPTVVHFHDPELIPVGFLLKRKGARLVYDVHEDVPLDILSKYWIPGWLRRPVAWAVGRIEALAARDLDAIVAATPSIAEKFPPDRTVLLRNLPILDELVPPSEQPYSARAPDFAYVGGLTEGRGIPDMVQAIGLLHTATGSKLLLGGRFVPATLAEEVRGLPGWECVKFLGWTDRGTMAAVLGSVRAGILPFRAIPNHMDAAPNKLFEYMAAGIPVIASDLPFIRKIIMEERCGVLFEPSSPETLASAMQWVLENPEESEAMGRRGRAAIERTYSWDREERALLALYHTLLGS